MFTRLICWLFNLAPVVEAKEEPKREDAPRGSFFSTEFELTPGRPVIEFVQERVAAHTVRNSLVYTGDGKEAATWAEDANNSADSLKAVYAMTQVGIPDMQAAWYGSQSFIGYQMCALIAQHWLVNKACFIPARDAVRKGFKLTVNDGTEVDQKILDALAKSNKRHRINRQLVEFVKMGRVFGIRVALFKVESTDPDYYVKPFNPDGITPGSYRGIVQIDPYWCVPELTSGSANDPSAQDFYEPTYWIVNNQRYHRSHLVIMRGPEVADILKPAYLYGGLSVPQLIFERVYAAERTANEAPQLALTKRAMVFYTDAAKALANQAAFEDRLAVWARFRDNFGIKVADKDADQIEQHDTSLSELDAVIMTQYQIVAGIANIPVTKLLGTQLKGFSTGDGEAENYHEELESIQTNDMEPLLERHMVCVMRSEIAPRFGVEPFGVDIVWEPLDSLSSVDAATVRKTNAEADQLYVTMGAVDGHEVRAKLSADEDSGFNGLPLVTDDHEQEENSADQ